MITERELKSVELSPTKKDFYQIWNELLDTASKLSERWDPASTNESDPGIVLLKVLTAIADKLNYTVDKNILEAYMPSATQEESMRKLCEMLGYDMKYFQSATTDVTIRYTGTEDLTTTNGSYQVVIPKYSYVTNTDKDIVYCLLEDVIFADADTSKTVEAIEGQLVQCKINMKNTTVIDASQIDDNNRYYFPEAQIAENGIFVYSCKLTEDGKAEAQDEWKKVSNLNTQAIGAKVYKFGFDSRLNLPYIQFADDIRDIIGEGLNISFVRTNGVNGNISAGTLTSLQNSSDLHVYKNLTEEVKDTSFSDATKYTITNKAATNNGKNKETLNSAYNNYKKTIGTFDTLVTCRDYINKIYQMTEGDFEESRSTTPLVSNVIVSDIRDDINRAYTLCSFNEYGISYSSKSFIEDDKDKISHFDLILYPFKTVNGLNTKSEYKNSFTYTTENVYSIKKLLQNEKTISHNIVDPENDEIACIKNYVRLNAKITTVYKVGVAEEKEILNKIYTAIYENFNARKIDFGEEIPYDTILEVIENADTRIKNVSLEEPELFSKVCLVSGEEIDLTVGNGKSKYFDKVVLSNILAGKVSLFNYITDFKADYSELPYSTEDQKYPDIVYPETADKKIVSIETSFKPSLPIDENNGRKLLANEVIEFRTPNLKTTTTYPAYVNYYLNLRDNKLTADKVAIPATFVSFKEFVESGELEIRDGKLHKLNTIMDQPAQNWGEFAKYMADILGVQPEEVKVTHTDSFKVTRLKELTNISAVFVKFNGEYLYRTATYIDVPKGETEVVSYYYFKFQNADDFGNYEAFIRNIILDDIPGITLGGLYNRLAPDLSRTIGEMIDINKAKYIKMNTMKDSGIEVYGYTNCYVQETHPDVFPTSDTTDPARASSEWHTKDGLGRAGEKTGITENSDYMLQAGDYLLINYTSSSTDENGAQTTGDTINLKYGEGTIIKPNFTLSDSATRNMLGDAFEKVKSNGVEGFHFEKENPPGMYTLGVNDKIEIRDNILVEFGGPNLSSTTAKQEFVNIYFQLAHEEPENNFVKLKFDEDNNTSYTLKEGEFFYYTDKNETELGYFGCGTKITRSSENVIIKKPFVSKDEEEETYDNILTYGLLASIPWQPYTFDATNYLTVTEYKYITLSEDDTIYSIDFPVGAADQELSSEWVAVNSASYKFSTDKEEDNPQKLPEVVGAQRTTGWQACSKLYLNMSPVKTQKLNANDVITINYSDNTTLTIEAGTRAAANGEVSGEATVIPVSVKANDLLIVHDSKYIVPEEDQEKLKIKIIEEAELNIFGGDGDIKEALSLNNFGNGWTKVITNNVTDSVKTGFKKLTELHTAIQRDKEFGIFAVYYITSEAEKEKFASMTVTYTEGPEANPSDPVIFNNYDSTHESWWTGYTGLDSTGTITHYFLKPGLNVIKLNEQNSSPDITFYYGKSGSENDIILFSELDLVDAEMPLNPWLGYDDTEATLAYDRLCGDIRAKYDPNHEFYYNVVPEASTALNMNTAKDITDNDSDILANPRMLYDYNNYFNKFVISEIDDDAMKKGIMIARSSRK